MSGDRRHRIAPRRHPRTGERAAERSPPVVGNLRHHDVSDLLELLRQVRPGVHDARDVVLDPVERRGNHGLLHAASAGRLGRLRRQATGSCIGLLGQPRFHRRIFQQLDELIDLLRTWGGGSGNLLRRRCLSRARKRTQKRPTRPRTEFPERSNSVRSYGRPSSICAGHATRVGGHDRLGQLAQTPNYCLAVTLPVATMTATLATNSGRSAGFSVS